MCVWWRLCEDELSEFWESCWVWEWSLSWERRSSKECEDCVLTESSSWCGGLMAGVVDLVVG